MKKFEGIEQIGFTVNKAHNVAFGTVGEYKFIINFLPQQRQYSIIATMKNDNETGVLSQYLETMDKGQFINWTHYKDHAVIVNLKNDKNLTVWDLDKIMKEIAGFASQNGYVQCCRHCGQETPIDVCSINGYNDLSCPNCLGQLAENQPKLKEVNLPLGIVGALAGSLIGVLVWVIIYKMGFVAGITGFIMSVCCFKGYEMLGGRIDKKGVWIAVAIAIVMLGAAELISVGLEIYDVFGEMYGISMADAFRAIPAFLEEPEIMGPIVKDLLFGYVFMVAASFSYIKNINRTVSTDGVVERLG